MTESILAQGRKRDGIEGLLALVDRVSGESQSIVLFRDQAAMDGYEAYSREKAAEVGADVTGRIYSKVMTPFEFPDRSLPISIRKAEVGLRLLTATLASGVMGWIQPGRSPI